MVFQPPVKSIVGFESEGNGSEHLLGLVKVAVHKIKRPCQRKKQELEIKPCKLKLCLGAVQNISNRVRIENGGYRDKTPGDQRNENQNLSQTIQLQEDELSSKEDQIHEKEEELALIEARIQELLINSKVSEADAYYARAQAVEETANRTVLAPKKKKASYQEAIDLYKKALSLGKKEAKAKISALEKKM